MSVSAEVGPPPYYHRSDCTICRKQDDLKTGPALLDVPRPGGYIVEREHFLAEHAPLQESSAGTVILEARRHLLDFADMTPAELAEVGSILKHEGELLGAAYLAQQPPLTSSFGDAEAMSDKIREQFKQS
jgi:diadenosine tetraphosphate (Ap4A) HIT family hydrolase